MKATSYRNIVILVYVLLLPLIGFSQRAGDLDRSFNYGRGENYGFNYGYGANNIIHTTALQPDGKIIIAGEFIFFNGTEIIRIARLNIDGSLDVSFNPGTGVNGTVSTINLQPDGKIVVGGGVGLYNGIARRCITRLNTDGSLDTTFNPGTGGSDRVDAVALQPDGKLVIGGNFTTFNGNARSRVARLNADGSIDATFNPGIGANNLVDVIVLQPNGKLIIGGQFTSFNGTPRNLIARLNTDGSLDASFNPGTGANGGSETSIRSFALQLNGKLIIGGEFTTFNGIGRNRIARLNTNGTLDTTFNPGTGASFSVFTTLLQTDGKIILGGRFSSFNNNTRMRIARLNIDGSLDTAFNTGGGTSFVGSVRTAELQPDGKFIIGGDFTSINGIARNRIARLNSDGSLDSNFNPGIGASDRVMATALQPDGKIIIGGEFTTYNGFERNYLTRINIDGSLDTTFNLVSGINGRVGAVVLQPDGKIIIGGSFTAINSNVRNHIARLNADGSIDSTFNLSTSARLPLAIKIALQPDGKIFVGGDFSSSNYTRIVRLNADGSLDGSFNPNISGNGSVYTSAFQPDGKIIIAGDISPYNGFSRNSILRLNTDGSLDATFNSGIGSNSSVWTTTLQPDGKIIIGGSFAVSHGAPRNRIARLNSDGSLDTTFIQGSGASGSVINTYLQPDGKIIIAGNFGSYNGTVRQRIARLNTNGSLDTTLNQVSGSNDIIFSIALQPDGKLIVGGIFTSFNNLSTPAIFRIHGSDCPNSTPILVTGNTSFCFGESTILTSSQLTGNLWNTGDTTRSIVVTSPGEYTVRTMNNGCTSSFSGIIRVTTLDSIITPNISGDTSLCAGTSTRLTSSSTTGNLWSTGDTTNTITISTPGYYTVRKITGICTSAVSSPLAVRFEISTPTISGDSTICSGNTTRLTSSSPTGNLWSTGDTTQFINVSQAGSYTVRVINGGCTSAVSAPFRVVNAGPSPTVINFDTTSNRCLGARLQLTPARTFAHYQWNTGERTRSIYTRTSGQYSVQVANSDSCFGLPSPPIFIAFDTNWCSVEIFRVGIDSITANVWADYYIWYLDGIELLSSNTLKTIPVQGEGVYTFRAVVGGRTSPLSNPIVITSARKSLVTKFEVYPNPASNKVTVNTSGTGTLEILNTLGQVVITQTATATNELNISQLAKGVYTVRFNGASKMLVVK